ncbi:MAG: DUF4249 family protein [Lewinellaceae bacterium]|nr:DUF4249 family protein [Lewinellaceae bacterium]
MEEIASGKRIQLTRVDGNLEGYVRQDGIFATQPNWLYKTKEPVKAGTSYRVRIIRNDGKPDVTAETAVPGDFFFRDPNQLDVPVKVTFERDKNTGLSWLSDVNGVYFRVNFRIRYRENALNGTLIKRDTLYWTPIENVRRTDVQSSGSYVGMVNVSSESFFRFLVESLPPAPNSFRRFEGIDITLEGGGREIDDYIESATANAGITGAELISTYTNLSEGFGIFTAKNVITLPNVFVTPQTVTSMNLQSPERDLNFQ